MALALTPRLLRRGLALFAIISLAGVVALLFYGDNLRAFLDALASLHWGWLALGLVLASMDWVGGGTRLWVVARHVQPHVRLRDMIVAGGMSAWGGYLTPFQTGAGPMMMWTMKRAGVRLPLAFTATFMTFVATVAFFAIAGPLAIVFGAGRSLREHGVVLGIGLYGLFKISLGVFVGLGLLMLFLMVFPRLARDLVHWLAGRLGKRSRRIAAGMEQLREGIEYGHQCFVAFGSPRGWLAIFWAVILSAPSHANKLLAGYVALRALGIPADFLEVLLIQTLITFVLYFAPTPGGSGLAEGISTVVMSIYVPRPLIPSYTLVWRFINSYATVIVGSLVFWGWLRRGLIGMEESVAAEARPSVRRGA
ncbi:MAG TPA: lysylphosphatidylglycerol synthase transmembrane domain-containing protein [Gemmatimonadales bacterium]|nr:lysylphosphatidylglycerol synthase transmembrane domain-containing protein [Gemmatimonadales bacterium]